MKDESRKEFKMWENVEENKIRIRSLREERERRETGKINFWVSGLLSTLYSIWDGQLVSERLTIWFGLKHSNVCIIKKFHTYSSNLASLDKSDNLTRLDLHFYRAILTGLNCNYVLQISYALSFNTQLDPFNVHVAYFIHFLCFDCLAP